MLSFSFREPQLEDAAILKSKMAPFVPYVGTSPTYTYLLIAQHFSSTSVVAQSESGELAGFISAYIIPDRKKRTLFLWEIAVFEGFHGNNLYIKMASHLIDRLKPDYVHASTNPSNVGSSKRLKALGEKYNSQVQKMTFFDASLFGESTHEQEDLYAIGPIGYAEGKSK